MVDNLIDTVPEKFKAKDGSLNTQALLRSYQELEKKIGSMVCVPTDDDSDETKKEFYRKIGVPENAQAYKIEVKNELLAADPEVNQKLYDLGFTNKQVQAVYDLAAEKVLPVIEELAQEYEASRQRQALENYFGGAEKFNEVARQLSAWAKLNVDENLLSALSTTYEGVLALYKMMETSEPLVKSDTGFAPNGMSEADLKQIMMSPAYWRDQNPELLQKVADGFNRLYPAKKNKR